VLGGEVEEREQRVELAGDLGGRLGELGEPVGEALHGDEGVGAGLGPVDVGDSRLGFGMHPFGHDVETVRGPVHPTPLLSGGGEHVTQPPQNPRAPSPTASTAAATPRSRSERSTSAQLSVDSR
jgi:hypothetical protein